MSRTLLYVHVIPITYNNVSVLCNSECACLHQTVNRVVFVIKVMKYLPKRESTHANVQSCPSNEIREFLNTIIQWRRYLYVL